MTIGETVTLDQLETDPYPIYARLRDEEPVSWVPAVGLWLVTRHDDVRLIDLSPEAFTAATEPSTLNRTMGENMLGMEGPEQRWIRAITEIPYRPRDVEARTRGMIPELANELVDAIVVGGEADLFHAYADPMSVRSLRFMLGLDEVPWEDILRWNEGLMPGLANFADDPEKQAPADRASASLGSAIERVLDRRAEDPDDSVLSWMLHHEEDGRRMSRAQIVANTKLMLSGGLQEPRDLIALTLWALGRQPSLLDEVRVDRALVKPTVEETLRWAGPVGTSTRQTTRGRAGGDHAPPGRPGRRRARLREPRPATLDGPRPLRPPSQGGRAPRVRRRDALLPGGLVRAIPGTRVPGCAARPPPGAPARSWAPGHAARMGVPRAGFTVGPVGSTRRMTR